MRYRAEILNSQGVCIWAQVGTVEDSGVWTFDLAQIARDLAEGRVIEPQELLKARIKWGTEVDRD